jgi:hypothetical protein
MLPRAPETVWAGKGTGQPCVAVGSPARPRRAYAVRFSEVLTATGLVSAR